MEEGLTSPSGSEELLQVRVSGGGGKDKLFSCVATGRSQMPLSLLWINYLLLLLIPFMLQHGSCA